MRFPLFFLLVFLAAGLSGQGLNLNIDPENPPRGIFADEWMEIFMNGEKIGFERITLEREDDFIVTKTRNHMKMGRDEALVSMDTVSIVREKLDGTPISMSEITKEGILMTKMEIAFDEDGAVVTKTAGGRTWDHTARLEPGYVVSWGLFKDLVELLRSEPGTAITTRTYIPELTVNQALPTKSTFVGTEPIDFRGRTVEALRLEQTIRLGIFPVTATIWMDEDGETLKAAVPVGALDITMLKATEEQAKAEFQPNDLFTASLIELNEPIPFGKHEVTYRLTTAEEVFTLIEDSLNQSVEREDETTYRVTVRKGTLPDATHGGTQVESKYLEPSRLVDYEDPVIQALLPDGIHEMSFPDKVRALVRATDSAIATKSMDFGFATASETAKESEGDCTEHALLLAALARAVGIPARGASGLVGFYDADDRPRMGYHMWTQVWNGEHWLDLDAAYGEAETSPIRILLGTDDLSEMDPASEFLMIAEFMGQTEIDIVETQDTGPD